MVELRSADGRLGGAYREDRVHDVVAGHDVDHRVRRRRELRQLSAAVRQDQRLGHLEALDPPRVRVQPGRLDDGRADHGHLDTGADVGDHPLTERLGEGVDVGPAERAGALGAGFHQLGLHPLQPAPLGVRCGRQVAGLAMFPLGLLAQGRQPLRGARLGLDQVPHRQSGPGLGLVVDGVHVRRLGDRAPPPPGGVGGGDVHVVRDLEQVAVVVGAGLDHPVHQRLGAEHVGGEGLVDGRIERHVPGAVHHDVDVTRQHRHVRQVALDHVDAAVQQRLRSPGGLPDTAEDVLLDHGDHPVPGPGGALPADQHRRRGVGQLGEDLPEQLLADEAGDAGHQDLLAGQQVTQPAVQQRAVRTVGDHAATERVGGRDRAHAG